MKNSFHIIIIVGLVLAGTACKPPAVPKERGYFRIDFPEKQYVSYSGDCPFSFDVPSYSKLLKSEEAHKPCWYNLDFTEYGATIYLTYKALNHDLFEHIEDVRTLVYKHTIKADDIKEELLLRRKDKVYGIVYFIEGNTASSLNFFATDSTKHFLSGSLYFNTQPNRDSLQPAISFFQQDIVHLLETLEWR